MADWHAIATTPSKESAGPTSLSTTASVSDSSPPPTPFVSRRSPVLCTHGCVSSSQPLASSVGLRILRDMGGNAADAAVAVAAVLAVTEPCSTGLGGDMFALHYSSDTKKVSCVNGSGRSPAALDLDVLRRDCPATAGGGSRHISEKQFLDSAHVVTVPGAARGWEDFLRRHGSGRMGLAELLEPAAEYAEGGFPVAPMTADHWSKGVDSSIRRWLDTGRDNAVPLTVDGRRGPRPGEVMRNPDMARVLRELGSKGATEGFYEGETGRAIVDALRKRGGVMTVEDLASHVTSTFPDPICAEYRGMKLWQVPPNGQGVAGLIALTGLSELEERGIVPSVSRRDDLGDCRSGTLHAMIEMMRLGFGDARAYVCDPDFAAKVGGKTNDWLLGKDRIGKRAAAMFDPQTAAVQGHPLPESCTVSFQVIDSAGDAVSFVNSNYMGFGSGIVPDGCGFSLHNRGAGFSLDPSHPNALEPRKRPYHTIIPGMITHVDTDELYATVSNMGGFMQPQGHLQLTVAMVGAGLDPQEAVDLPRFCIGDGTSGGTVFIEDGVAEEVVRDLERMGHNLRAGITGHERSVFGRAQIIKRDRKTGVLWAGSDGRADGCAMGY